MKCEKCGAVGAGNCDIVTHQNLVDQGLPRIPGMGKALVTRIPVPTSERISKQSLGVRLSNPYVDENGNRVVDVGMVRYIRLRSEKPIE